MSAPPAVPPRPYDYGYQEPRPGSAPAPPVPPRLQTPMTAPRPTRMDPNVGVNMAQTLDDQLYPTHQQHGQAYLPPASPYGTSGINSHTSVSSINYTPGFVVPGTPNPYGAPPPQQQPYAGPQQWTPWAAVQQQQPQQQQQQVQTPSYSPLPFPGSSSGSAPGTPGPYPTDRLSQSLASLTFSPAPSMTPPIHSNSLPPVNLGPPPSTPAEVLVPIPTIESLEKAVSTIQNPAHDPAKRLNWARDVLYLIDKAMQHDTTGGAGAGEFLSGNGVVRDPGLLRLVEIAVGVVRDLAQSSLAEAQYLSAALLASQTLATAVPTLGIQHDPRRAFREFETAARGGYGQAWFRLGRDYEGFGDAKHAKDCFERGVNFSQNGSREKGVGSCCYRMGMAHLLGQLGLQASVSAALPLLLRAAQLSTLDTPQPAYVYSLLLLGEFTPPPVPGSSNPSTPITVPHSLIPPGSTHADEARKFLVKSSSLHYPAAQYKLAHCYEFATPSPPFGFDPLLSVEWYTAASKGGEVEADMALSKWFLCGAEGVFDKDEGLALTFAQRAAEKGLPSAEFAMGYYAEVGIGQGKNVDKALGWYRRALEHGNEDAKERVAALDREGPGAQGLSRREHENISEVKVVRARTIARERGERNVAAGSLTSPTYGPQGGRTVVEGIKQAAYAEQQEPSQSQLIQQQWQQQQRPQGYSQGGRQRRESNPTSRPQTGGHGRSSSSNANPPPRPPSAGGTRPSHLSLSAGRPGMGRVPSSSNLNQSLTSPVPPLPSPMPPRTPATATPSNQPTSTTPNPSKKPGPATFAEMGFQGVKAEDKDCVIM